MNPGMEGQPEGTWLAAELPGLDWHEAAKSPALRAAKSGRLEPHPLKVREGWNVQQIAGPPSHSSPPIPHAASSPQSTPSSL